jgi:hypothetical protein
MHGIQNPNKFVDRPGAFAVTTSTARLAAIAEPVQRIDEQGGFVSVAAEPRPPVRGAGWVFDPDPSIRIQDADAWAELPEPLLFTIVAGADGIPWGAPYYDVVEDRKAATFAAYVEAEAKWIDGFIASVESGAYDDPEGWMD